MTVEEQQAMLSSIDISGSQKAFFALGCYWGAEAVFRCTKGVVCTRVGFMVRARVRVSSSSSSGGGSNISSISSK